MAATKLARAHFHLCRESVNVLLRDKIVSTTGDELEIGDAKEVGIFENQTQKILKNTRAPPAAKECLFHCEAFPEVMYKKEPPG